MEKQFRNVRENETISGRHVHAGGHKRSTDCYNENRELSIVRPTNCQYARLFVLHSHLTFPLRVVCAQTSARIFCFDSRAAHMTATVAIECEMRTRKYHKRDHIEQLLSNIVR